MMGLGVISLEFSETITIIMSVQIFALEYNFDLSKGKAFAYGRGIYSSPDPVVAEGYAKTFTFENQQYRVIIQNKVNMKGTEHIQSVNYFLTKEEKDIRPYALLYKKV